MTETPKNRDIVLGDRTFSVPPLPIKYNRVVYPICRDLVIDDLLERCKEAGNQIAATEAEFDQMIELAFHAAQAADPTITRDDFDNLPITPIQLLNAFFQVRYQTGGWVELPQGESAPEGEAEGAQSPQP